MTDLPARALRVSTLPATWVALLAMSLLLSACSRAPQSAPIGPWVPGTHFTVLSSHPQTTGAAPGTVQVLEAFWYGCPHCYALDPYLEHWRVQKPAYVRFERVPVTWNEEAQAHARLFYALQTLGKVDQLHTKIFDAIHQQSDLLYVQGNYVATLEDQERFMEANGIDGATFGQAFESNAVDADLKQADELVRRYRIDSVPTIVIDGRYKTDVGMAGGEEKLIELIGALVASEHNPAAH